MKSVGCLSFQVNTHEKSVDPYFLDPPVMGKILGQIGLSSFGGATSLKEETKFNSIPEECCSEVIYRVPHPKSVDGFYPETIIPTNKLPVLLVQLRHNNQINLY